MPVHVRARACPPTPQSTHPTCPLHRAQRLQQALPPPVHGVVVGQAGHVDAGRREDGDVGWVHAVVDALVGPGHRVRGDSGLQIYHPGLRLPARHVGQGHAPRVRKAAPLRQRAIRRHRQLHVLAGILHPALVQLG